MKAIVNEERERELHARVDEQVDEVGAAYLLEHGQVGLFDALDRRESE